MSERVWSRESATADVKALLRTLLKGYVFDVEGLHLKDGTIHPLPSESAVVGKVIELSLLLYFRRQLLSVSDLNPIDARSTRTYPDLTLAGSRYYPNVFAIDVKCARRQDNGRRIRSAIAIGTFDAEYFHYPGDKVGNIERPYASYAAHLVLIGLYDYVGATARNVEVLVAEKWRVATRKKASGTRSYIATSSKIEDLIAERGDFESEEEFNEYWRSQPVKPSKRAAWEKARVKRHREIIARVE
jgi:hypothetical protein